MFDYVVLALIIAAFAAVWYITSAGEAESAAVERSVDAEARAAVAEENSTAAARRSEIAYETADDVAAMDDAAFAGMFPVPRAGEGRPGEATESEAADDAFPGEAESGTA